MRYHTKDIHSPFQYDITPKSQITREWKEGVGANHNTPGIRVKL